MCANRCRTRRISPRMTKASFRTLKKSVTPQPYRQGQFANKSLQAVLLWYTDRWFIAFFRCVKNFYLMAVFYSRNEICFVFFIAVSHIVAPQLSISTFWITTRTFVILAPFMEHPLHANWFFDLFRTFDKIFFNIYRFTKSVLYQNYILLKLLKFSFTLHIAIFN